jgi:NHS family xanthosine MFS transporter
MVLEQYLGSIVSGWMIQKYFTKAYTNIQALADHVGSTTDNKHLLKFLGDKGISVTGNGDLSRALDVKDWHNVWLSFTIYALVITVLFMIFFKHKHTRAEVEAIEAIGH